MRANNRTFALWYRRVQYRSETGFFSDPAPIYGDMYLEAAAAAAARRHRLKAQSPRKKVVKQGEDLFNKIIRMSRRLCRSIYRCIS